MGKKARAMTTRAVTASLSGDDDDGDPYNLVSRFVEKQRQGAHARALDEINAGQKCSCWMWWIFPTPPWAPGGVERGSHTNRSYALRDKKPNDKRGDDAAQAYLRFEHSGVNLRNNYLEVLTAAVKQLEAGVTCRRLFGGLDDPKLRSSVKLFERASRGGFDEAVNEMCLRALNVLEEEPLVALELDKALRPMASTASAGSATARAGVHIPSFAELHARAKQLRRQTSSQERGRAAGVHVHRRPLHLQAHLADANRQAAERAMAERAAKLPGLAS